ncbi:iron-containing redox enzyme family protein [Streptomyces sp. SID8352]|uniref:iron-containing redox enzyme family protein n=1 Tax=Streptomyces sp. SID8352 TaxID=2690338 RepID=UPI00136C00AE|nr:hypothetical protein [Streptomyces sp. SID8352]
MGAAPFSRVLRTKLSLAEPAVHAAAALLWRPDGLRPRYLAYLGAMHALVRASVPLMERAVARCEAAPPGDPVARPLARYLRRHIEEERGHDDWLLADLALAGGDAAAVRAALPPTAVAVLTGAPYYWVEHHHPAVLLGYMAALEGNAPAGWLAEHLAAGTGLPDAAFRTLRAHAALDSAHVAALDRVLDRLPLTGPQRTAVSVGALHTVSGLARLLSELAARPARTAAAPSGGHR